ncbi:hypothetical protein HMPREF1068_03471 [Bacteroides nordii CL02T12C05]|uniref:Transposase n=1 Tax=Bacteroides nordii CL02T12C05 TaxID=997884 RepID=I9RVD5_9BACE|nr:hypothetical protein HMPREF1068_03471 [Bacteroides nordii CL02T12C05]
MYSSGDLEKRWFLYKLEGQSRNISIEDFCLQQGVSCRVFYKWFCSCKKSIAPVEIVSMPSVPVSQEADSEEPSISQDVIVQSLE